VNLQVLFSALAVLVGGAAAADEIVSSKSMERNQPADFAYRFDTALTGFGSFDIAWSDVVGRMVERRRIPLDLADSPEMVFSLDLSYPICNQLLPSAREKRFTSPQPMPATRTTPNACREF
jgi:hypothetical protein